MADIILDSYAKGSLTSAGTAGRLARVTDDARGVWMDSGFQFFSTAARTFNVEEFGALGDGDPTAPKADDNRKAFQAAVDAADSAGGGTIVIPPGTFVLARNPDTPSPNGCVILDDKSKIRFVGAGAEATIVKLEPLSYGNNDTHVFQCRDSSYLVFEQFTIDGSIHDPPGDEQKHGIRFYKCTDMIVRNCRFYKTRGDGIYLLGESGNETQRFLIDGNTFSATGRSGIVHGNYVRYGRTTHNYFELMADQSLDMESSKGLADLVVAGNSINHSVAAYAVQIAGNTDADPAKRIVFVNNVIVGGPITITRTEDCVISGNVIKVAPNTQRVEIKGYNKGLRFTNNVVQPNQYEGLKVIVKPRDPCATPPVPDSIPFDIDVSDNEIEPSLGTSDGISVDQAGDNIRITGNRIVTNTGVDPGVGIRVDAKGSGRTHHGYVINGNTIVNFRKAIFIHVNNATSEKFESLSIYGNTFDDNRTTPTQTIGIEFEDGAGSGTNMAEDALAVGNVYGRGITTPISRQPNNNVLPFWAIGGNPGAGVADFEGNGPPVIAAPIGSTYRNKDGGDDSTLYVKSSGTGTTGWVAMKSVPP